MAKKKVVYPYIPNSVPEARARMLQAVNAASTEEFYADVPKAIRLKGSLDLPMPLLAEADLVRHMEGLMAKNTSTRDVISFLGGGCWNHHVPAVCDEINSRGEFLTAYAGDPYEDHGRFQALFEYESMMGELLNMDVVNVPNYDGFQAAGTALLMAARITGRNQALVCGTISRDKLSKVIDYVRPQLEVILVDFEKSTGLMSLKDLQSKLSDQTAAVYFENPSYLGFLETHAEEIVRLTKAAGAQSVVSVDPISLGVIAPPADYGAQIVCGDIQPLGMHQNYGGGHAGFIATHDDPTYVMEFPSRLFGISPTVVPGEYGFGDVAYERTSFALREEGKEWVGTAAALWGITAGVYLALMGPQGMQELGESVMKRCAYAQKQLAKLPGVKMRFKGVNFKEFVLDFNATGKTVKTINQKLLKKGIFGGSDLSAEFLDLGECALYAVTETTSQADIDCLVTALTEVLK